MQENRRKPAKPAIAITLGDYNGIGPEVILKSIAHPLVRRSCSPVLVGPRAGFQFYDRGRHLEALLRNAILVDVPGDRDLSIKPGVLSGSAGRTAARAIELAVAMSFHGLVEGIVTAPVSKQAFHRGGIRFPGQTEMLQKLTHSPAVAMMLVSRTMKVGLATIHIPLRGVSGALSRKCLTERIHIIHDALMLDWGIPHPRLAILGLNPHAGEGGDIGSEERTVIAPVLRACRRAGLALDGPFPADAFFARYRPGLFDGVVAMYHDQGLIPLKMSAEGKAVNVSAGLPIVRTSPDHGTAFDIAGQGVANPDSMIEAILLAARIATRRRTNLGRKLP